MRPRITSLRRAEAAAGDDAGAGLGGVEENLAARAGGLEAGEFSGGAVACADGGEGVVEQDAVRLFGVVKGQEALVELLSERRVDARRAQSGDDEIAAINHCRPKGWRCHVVRSV